MSLSELDIIRTIWLLMKKPGVSPKAVVAAFHGILMLANSLKEMPLEIGTLSSTLYKEPKGYRHSLSLLSNLLESWGQLSVREAIGKAIVSLSLKLHLGVAKDRWYTTGNFNFRFMPAEEGGFCHVAPKDSADMTENKVRSFLSILSDIGYLQYTDGEYSVTDEGLRFIDEIE